ncbi:hypothetical protein CULC0102_0026 [Corynebacterium ulcerans 0102]|nr:hypothetical protein CULC0102_0026 [Corynebacterium ulcerans 0102]
MLFSAYAEVVLKMIAICNLKGAFLRVRGGSSAEAVEGSLAGFLFSAYAEVVPVASR